MGLHMYLFAGKVISGDMKNDLSFPYTCAFRQPPSWVHLHGHCDPLGNSVLAVAWVYRRLGNVSSQDHWLSAADENNKSKAKCQTPHIPRMTWTAPTRGPLGMEHTKRVKEKHTHYSTIHVALPDTKIRCIESASARNDSIALHCRGYDMW